MDRFKILYAKYTLDLEDIKDKIEYKISNIDWKFESVRDFINKYDDNTEIQELISLYEKVNELGLDFRDEINDMADKVIMEYPIRMDASLFSKREMIEDIGNVHEEIISKRNYWLKQIEKFYDEVDMTDIIYEIIWRNK